MLFAMVLAMPAAAMAQVPQQPAPMSSKLPPGLTFSVAVRPEAWRGHGRGRLPIHQAAARLGSVEVAMNRFMLAQGELFTWSEQSSGTWRGT